MDKLQIKLLTPGAVMPAKATDGSAGYDLFFDSDAPAVISRGKITFLHTGVAIALEPGTCGLVFARSGLSLKHGVVPANAVGVIDSDYRGEIMVGLTCLLDEPYFIQPGERIAQLVLTPYYSPQLISCAELDDTQRSDGGFGSTGRF